MNFHERDRNDLQKKCSEKPIVVMEIVIMRNDKRTWSNKTILQRPIAVMS